MKKISAADFLARCEYPVFWYCSVGCPAGETIAIFEETELPVDLETVAGEVDANGFFAADNLGCDFWGNTIFNLKLYEDQAYWTAKRADWESIG